jgi:hypothetical protein
MPCYPFKSDDGTFIGMVCSRSRKTKCSVRGCSRNATYLCDYLLKGKKEGSTCDRPLCGRHAILLGEDHHFCPGHHRLWLKSTTRP